MSSLKGLKSIPSFVYGTAWKKEKSSNLVRQAINAGFRAVDTAAQPKHYSEDLVGAGIRHAIEDLNLQRDELWIQTKFTPLGGHDPARIPYDPAESIENQIKASISSSFSNLRMTQNYSSSHSANRTGSEPDNDDYLDAVLLHSPFPTREETLTAWEALCQYVPHKIRHLGISNAALQDVRDLCESTDVAPSIVQNPFHAGTGYDARLRDYCREKGVVYQSFWTLTANPHLLKGQHVQTLARKAGVSAEMGFYALVILGLDIRVLNGTTNEERMRADLLGIETVRQWRQNNRNEWMSMLSGFKGSLSRGRIL